MQEVEIRVKGQIDLEWSKWLGTLSIVHTDTGESLLTVQVRDQSALYGLIERLSRLGLPLISVDVAAAPQAGEEGRKM